VAHSLSPQLHNPALEHCGIQGQYIRLRVTTQDFQETLRAIHDLGFYGTNVTIPHKFTALQRVDVLDAAARRLGAVNTIVFRDGKSYGYNSDGPGFVRAIRAAFGTELRELRVAIIGAGGGAGRAVAVQCALEGCQSLFLANRSADKLTALSAEIAEFYPAGRISSLGLSEAEMLTLLPKVDLIVNATNLGMQPEDAAVVPFQAISRQHCVYDMVYKPAETRLLREAAAQGARVSNGLEMLLHQGCVSFDWWFPSQNAPVEKMRQGLQAARADG
jgi:shikimate dehydrogenase